MVDEALLMTRQDAKGTTKVARKRWEACLVIATEQSLIQDKFCDACQAKRLRGKKDGGLQDLFYMLRRHRPAMILFHLLTQYQPTAFASTVLPRACTLHILNSDNES